MKTKSFRITFCYYDATRWPVSDEEIRRRLTTQATRTAAWATEGAVPAVIAEVQRTTPELANTQTKETNE